MSQRKTPLESSMPPMPTGVRCSKKARGWFFPPAATPGMDMAKILDGRIALAKRIRPWRNLKNATR